eukprot:m.32427 g.32427  ORF g.32427 m.32427 type:complete len:348 (-) comp10786_c0_seq3:294-1337(-)
MKMLTRVGLSSLQTHAHVRSSLRQLHVCACALTKYPRKDDQYEFKLATLRPSTAATPADFLRDLGRTANGIIGPRLTIRLTDLSSRMGQHDKFVDLPPSAPRSRKTKHSFLLLDQDKADAFLKNAADYVFPETEGLDEDYDIPESTVISKDPECGNRRFDFVFVDTSDSATNTNRTIRIRQRDGTLRTATREEREQYNQEFFALPHKRKGRPDVCKNENLPILFKSNMHKLALDLAIKHLHPYQHDYRDIHERVYRDVVETGRFHALQDSAHWPAFVRWLIRTNQIHILVNTLFKSSRFKDAAKLVSYLSMGSVDVPESIEENKKAVVDYLQLLKRQQTGASKRKSN